MHQANLLRKKFLAYLLHIQSTFEELYTVGLGRLIVDVQVLDERVPHQFARRVPPTLPDVGELLPAPVGRVRKDGLKIGLQGQALALQVTGLVVKWAHLGRAIDAIHVTDDSGQLGGRNGMFSQCVCQFKILGAPIGFFLGQIENNVNFKSSCFNSPMMSHT